MKKESKIYVAGHRGMVGSAIVRELKKQGYTNIVTRNSQELDLTRQNHVESFFETEKPEYVFLAAAKVGGILANMTQQAQFLTQNLQIQTNVIDNAYKTGVTKLLFLGSSCIFPKDAEQPLTEESLLTGSLEPTNEGYAIAKISGLKLCEYYNEQQGADFISIMPCNLYGYNDNFDLQTSHFLPALIRKFYEAVTNNQETVTIWGTGKPMRELLFADDLADACIFTMNNYSGSSFLNVGYGKDYTITQVAEMIKKVSGFTGNIVYDTSKPDGMFRKIMDSTKINNLEPKGWKPKTSLEDGIGLTYQWYKEQQI